MTCPLCGQKEHSGPCYAELKREWRLAKSERRKQTLDEFLAELTEFENSKSRREMMEKIRWGANENAV
jgi:hypothetical protein